MVERRARHPRFEMTLTAFDVAMGGDRFIAAPPNLPDLPSAWPERRSGLWPWLIFALALGTTAVISRAAADGVDAKNQARFEMRVERTLQAIMDRLHGYEQLLRGEQRWIAASNSLTRHDWRLYVEGLPLQQHYPGVLGLSYVARVSKADASKFLSDVRADGAPEFGINPPGERDEYYVVRFIEPLARNSTRLGADCRMHPVARTAMERARDTGDITITAPIRLVQRLHAGHMSIVMYMPVFRTNRIPSDVEQRRMDLLGWVAASLCVQDLLNSVLAHVATDLECQAMDDSDPGQAQELFESTTAQRTTASSLVRASAITVGGRTWTLRFTPAPMFERAADNTAPKTAMAAGSLISFLLFGVSWSLRTTHSRAATLARRMTAALAERESQAHRLAVEAERATKSKSEFLANMSHEIRTPMTAILGYAELLADPHAEERDKAAAIETIRNNGEHLLTLVNDILDLSRIEADRMSIDRRPCSARQVVGDVARLMQIRATSKGLRLEVACDGLVPDTIVTDATRLRQILINLVSNAIKFTAAGSVRVTGRMTDASAGRRTLELEVTDTGIGIMPDQIQSLFQPFAQGDTSHTRQFGGAGLGLSISRRLAQMLGGDISVESKPGVGSTFRVRIVADACATAPQTDSSVAHREPSSTQPVAAQSQPRLTGRVLLAEDGIDNQRLITRVLERAGATVTSVDNGQAAVQAALQAAEAGVPFDVILMDIQMPVMDGYAAARVLRSQGYHGCIIALTAHCTRSDRDNCIAAGCTDYASKPIDRNRLVELLRRHGLSAPQAHAPTPHDPSTARSMEFTA